MQNNIFRKESMDRLKSPEQLNEYIRVARPAVWMILVACILILAGVIVWGIFGTAETVVRAGVLVENAEAVCYVDEEIAADIKQGMPVVIRELEGKVKAVSTEPIPVDGERFHTYLIEAAGLEAGSFCYAVEVDISGLEDGIYYADITVESVAPISFVIE